MLNFIWSGFFIVAFLSAIIQSFNGNTAVWSVISETLFSTAHLGFKIALDLTGVLCFWLGLMKIAEKSGLAEMLAKALKPLFHKIMPQIKKDSPAFGAIVMNIAANILGLDNAATPMGIKAMEELAKIDKEQHGGRQTGIASIDMCTFLIVNVSSLQLIPVNVIAYRSQYGSVNPASILGMAIVATFCSTAAGVLFAVIARKYTKKHIK